MELDSLTVGRVMSKPPSTGDVGWFAARQPAILRFLEERLGGGSDAFGVAFDAAWRICRAFRERNGVPAPRATEPLLSKAEKEAYAETAEFASFGWAARQPALCGWIADLVADPPVPLTTSERRTVGLSLAAVVYALDQLTTGREIV